jgi:hypothetical protein
MKRIAIIFTVLALFTTSCIKDMICVNGNGIIETETRNTSSFNQIENSTVANVIYRQSDDVTITVVAESNLLGHIVTENINGNLKIRTDHWNTCLDYTERPVITVTSPELKNIELSGSGDIFADVMSGNSLIIKLSGSGKIVAESLSCNDLSVIISGSGDVEISEAISQDADFNLSGSGDLDISGTSDKGHYRISGSGDINSDEFQLNNATETISGSGDIFTFVTNSLTATISGSGNIYLKGDPTINQNISGSGRIIKY